MSEADINASSGPARDFSQPIAFDLRIRKPNKTVDIGRDGISLSLDACGRILQASAFHPEHGIVVAVPFEQFDGSKFYDPTYVREYRKRMLQADKPGLGISFGADVDKVSINILKVDVATFEFGINEIFDVALRVEVLENGDILQTATVLNKTFAKATLPCDTNLSVSLNRASYGQLTEGGPIPLPESHNVLLPGTRKFSRIINPALCAQLACSSTSSFSSIGDAKSGSVDEDPDGTHVVPWDGQEARGVPLNFTIASNIPLEPQATVTIRNRFRLIPNIEPFNFKPLVLPVAQPSEHTNGEKQTQPSPWLHENLITTYILRRNVDYILANCTIPVSADSTCIVTDHVALPLGWNRDNYWQIRLLYETHKHASILLHPSSAPDYTTRIHAVAKGHLNWVFKTAQRPHGYWHRSYLVTGAPKDRAIFQLDQQCYPLLELCDYLDYFPSDTAFVRDILELDVVPQMLTLLGSKRDAETGLWPTDETPGDDAVIYPYHFSSHVLLWRTLTRLRDLYNTLYTQPPSAHTLDALAADLRIATLRSFTAKQADSGDTIFAYLTDGKGAQTRYHDANDVPTFFVLPWSFLTTPAEHATYHATLSFGLSPANTQGYCNDGAYPGLGSVHSPGAWTLGYYQELAYAGLRRDEGAMRTAWGKVARSMQWDGTFGEAVDVEGRCSSKAWFSWPGSMIGVEVIRLRVEGLEGVLVG